MKIGPLKRNLTTICSLAVALSCLMVGCIRQPTEVISQSDSSTKDPLLHSKNSSSFNYFQWKKPLPVDEAVARVKISEDSPVDEQIESGFQENVGRVEFVAHSDNKPSRLADPLSKQPQKKRPKKEVAKAKDSSWRTKSLIESAKKYPSRISEAYQQRTDRIRHVSNSITQGISTRIKRISNKVPTSSEEIEEAIEPETKTTNTKTIPLDQFRSSEVSRFFEQASDDNQRSNFSKLEEDFHQDSIHSSSTLNGEMRRLQVSAIMDRAKREFEKKNYEYAAFLAEQALESSYRGHIAFRPEEESPKKLLQRIKKHLTPRQEINVQKVEHTKPRVQTNGGQVVQNFQFSPATVHPLKRRVQDKRINRGTKSRDETSTSQELPLIVPRNLGTDQETITIRKKNSSTQKTNEHSHGISLDVPVFEQKTEEKTDVSVPEKPILQKQKPAPQPEVKQETISKEPPTKIHLGSPEAIQQESEKAVQKSTSPGPQLMLPNLPSGSEDLTSQTNQKQLPQQTAVLKHQNQNRGIQTAPVKFQSKVRENQKKAQSPDKVVQGESNAGKATSGLTLDEIEWELDQKVQPPLNSGWSGLSALLLIVGGAIILLLLTIIFILLRRGNSPSEITVSDEVGPKLRNETEL